MARSDASAGCRKLPRAIRGLLAGALALALVYALYPLALRCLAAALSDNESNLAEPDFVCMAAGGNGLAEAVIACRRRPGCQILLISQRSNRLVEVGVLTRWELQMRRSLEEAGVVSSQIMIDERPVATEWEMAERMSDRLAADPQASLLILCDQFSGRRWRQIVRNTAPDHVARRIHVQSVRDSAVDMHDWWHSKAGIQGIYHGLLGLIFAVVHWRESVPCEDSPAAEYEELSLQRSILRH